MPRRRGFDVLLDSGFSPDDVAHMRRQFYEGRGEEVPDEIDTGDLSQSLRLFPFNVKPQVKVYELIMWDEQMANMREPWKNSG